MITIEPPNASDAVRVAFIILPIVVALVVWLFHRHAWNEERRGPSSLAFGAAIFLWMGSTGGLALSDVLTQFELKPPPFAFLILAVIVLSVGTGLSGVGRTLARLPLAWLVGLNAFRFPLELVMHQAAVEGVMPAQMSYTGLNFDIVTGITAILLAAAIAAGVAHRWLVAAWNSLGCLLLLNVMTIALISTPVIRAFGEDRKDVVTFVFFFPYVWLPTVLVSTAILLHVVIARVLLAQRKAARS